jgi:hypothetical protein
MLALLGEQRALAHTEAMLFVHDDETQPAELDAGLEQRMRADHQLHRSLADTLEQLAARRRPQGPGQHAARAVDLTLVEQPPDVAIVLLRQDLGRHHQGRLESVVQGDEQGQQRHDRLARPHVTLQQTVHRMGGLEVGADFLEHPFLSRGQLERQHLPQTRA